MDYRQFLDKAVSFWFGCLTISDFFSCQITVYLTHTHTQTIMAMASVVYDSNNTTTITIKPFGSIISVQSHFLRSTRMLRTIDEFRRIWSSLYIWSMSKWRNCECLRRTPARFKDTNKQKTIRQPIKWSLAIIKANFRTIEKWYARCANISPLCQ